MTGTPEVVHNSPREVANGRKMSKRQDKQSTSRDSQDSNILSTEVEKRRAAEKDVEKSNDSIVVDYEGENDQLNAQNWPARKKWSLVALLAAMTFVT